MVSGGGPLSRQTNDVDDRGGISGAARLLLVPIRDVLIPALYRAGCLGSLRRSQVRFASLTYENTGALGSFRKPQIIT